MILQSYDGLYCQETQTRDRESATGKTEIQVYQYPEGESNFGKGGGAKGVSKMGGMSTLLHTMTGKK